VKKGIVTGLIIGILITSSVAFGADAIRNSYFNPDLKLAINGKPVQDLRIVTVELEGEQYGRNYYSIADLVKALNDFGGVVAKVDFDANTKTTVIDIEQKTVYITPIPEQSLQVEGREEIVKVIEPEKPKTPDGFEIRMMDSKQYVSFGDIGDKAYAIGYRFGKCNDGTIKLTKLDLTVTDRTPGIVYPTDEVILDDVPITNVYGTYCVELDYYIENIMPIINK
jgi:hypothetical protein